MRLTFEQQQKYLKSFIRNATYHPMNPGAAVTYQTVNLFSSNVLSASFLIRFDEISTQMSVKFW